MSAVSIDREYHRIWYHILFLPGWNPSDSFMLKRRITLATLAMAEGVFVLVNDGCHRALSMFCSL